MPERSRPVVVDDVIVLPEPPSPEEAGATKLREADALLGLSRVVAQDPEGALQRLAATTLSLVQAESAGVTVEDTGSGEVVLRWVATAGKARVYQDGTIPRHFSPCGEAIDRRHALMMQDLDRYFTYLVAFDLPIRTALLVPFARNGRFVGTVWAIQHTAARKFDTEQQRLVQGLATFASAILDASERRARN